MFLLIVSNTRDDRLGNLTVSFCSVVTIQSKWKESERVRVIFKNLGVDIDYRNIETFDNINHFTAFSVQIVIIHHCCIACNLWKVDKIKLPPPLPQYDLWLLLEFQ